LSFSSNNDDDHYALIARKMGKWQMGWPAAGGQLDIGMIWVPQSHSFSYRQNAKSSIQASQSKSTAAEIFNSFSFHLLNRKY
jgi:hypothetical protein